MEFYEDEDRTGDPDLGFGYSTTDEYLTGNDDNSPDPPEALDTNSRPIKRVDAPNLEGGDEVLGAGDSQVGLGEGTGTEAFDQDPRDSRGRIHDQTEIGNADMRTAEAAVESSRRRGDADPQ